MIAHIEGKIREKSDGRVTIDINGLGFEVFVSNSSLQKLPNEGEIASLYTYLHVREDIFQLFVFTTPDEKEMFLKLLSVSKIGPKIALSILSALSMDLLRKAIITGDVDIITTIPGIGKKGAQRLILELKEKLNLPDFSEGVLGYIDNSTYVEARDALTNLGYSLAEAAKALGGCSDDDSAEEMIKFALKKLAKR